MADRTPIADLSAAVLDSTPLDIDWDEAAGEDLEGFSCWQAFEYEHDGVTYTLVSRGPGGSVVAVFLPDSTRIDAYEWDEYAETITCKHCGEVVTLEDTGAGGKVWYHDHGSTVCGDDPAGTIETGQTADSDRFFLPEGTFDELCEVDPYQWGAEGPMMNYWYPLTGDSVDSIGRYGYTMDGVEAAAHLLRGTNLCVVEVGDTVGLALTGGGMDLTWSIVQGFTLLGYLPPVHFCEPPGFEHPEQDYLVSAMHRALSFQRDRLTNKRDALAAHYSHLAAEWTVIGSYNDDDHTAWIVGVVPGNVQVAGGDADTWADLVTAPDAETAQAAALAARN